MKYSLFFYILFMGLCGIYAASRHIRSLPKDEGVISNLTRALLSDEKTVILSDIDPNCPVPPMECPNGNITFWYYSRVLGEHPIPIQYTSSKSSGVHKGPGPWKVLIPGFAQKKEGFPVADLVSAYNEKDMYNMLAVDYYPLATQNCLLSAATNIPLIAKCTADLLEYLIGSEVFAADQLHVIGFGYGAHIAGYIHKYLNSGTLGRVTALDPYTLPSMLISVVELSEKSATFVDVHHTNALFYKIYPPAGHIDIYYNSGILQPGCYLDGTAIKLLTCSHEKVVPYFIESISYAGTDDGFYAIPCPNFWWFATKICVGSEKTSPKVGEDGDTNARGTFHLQTHKEPTYALGKVYEYIQDTTIDNFGGGGGGGNGGNGGDGGNGGNGGNGGDGGNGGNGGNGGDGGNGGNGGNGGDGGNGGNGGNGGDGGNGGNDDDGGNGGNDDDGGNGGNDDEGGNGGNDDEGGNGGNDDDGGNGGNNDDGGNGGNDDDGGNGGNNDDGGNGGNDDDGGNGGNNDDGGNGGNDDDGGNGGNNDDGGNGGCTS